MRSFLLIMILAAAGLAQNSPEVTATPATAIFRSSTNLVQVPVVVRGANGHTIGTLKAEDFHLSDNGKPQIISKFSVSKFETTAGVSKTAALKPPADAPASAIQVAPLPDRFVAYLFDDVHMSLGDLVHTREAAKRQIDSLNLSHQRIGIFTTSGNEMPGFTADLDRIHAALMAITTGRASAERVASATVCPEIGYFMGDLINNKHDRQAKGVMIAEAIAKCDYRSPEMAEQMVNLAARTAVLVGDSATEVSLNGVRTLISRLAAMPGQRSIVLISPGFLVLDDRHEEAAKLIDNAAASNVVISGLDARGLYTDGIYDAENGGRPNPVKTQYLHQEAIVQTDAMENLADGTGGIFYHGTNNYDEGFQRVGSPPEFVYLLAFSPELKKDDKSAHHLKVTLANLNGFTVQARTTYFANVKPEDPAEQIRQQIQDAFFSNEDVKTLPVRLQAEFFKDGEDATLTANVRVDAAKLALKKDDGRNLDNLTMVIGIFDSNGNFVQAFQKTIELRLKDETLSAWMKSGIENSTDFTLKPGKYLVRLVVRDSGGESMAEQSTGVDIPW
ncbi:MAG TPA: VWA domain-containing protein [Bryobacteraceae bacterium]|nr:VWA domain-containing protein [Bryobacteraceae bacterium]